MAKVALGKGLGALIGAKPPLQNPAPQPGEMVQRVPIAEIVPSPLQPRTEFRDTALQELVESIRERGIIQPLIVRRIDGKLELIAGERRWRAAKQAGLQEAPVIVRDASDLEVLETALIENLQREDLNPIEEARAYSRLAREFDLKQEEIARKVGKNRATVANAMRLLELPPQVQSYVEQALLTVGHAKVLLSVKNAEEQLLLAQRVIKESATVRATERMIAKLARGASGKAHGGGSGDDGLSPALRHVENRLREHLATHVTLHHGPRKGRIDVEYYGPDDLERILALIGLPPDE